MTEATQGDKESLREELNAPVMLDVVDAHDEVVGQIAEAARSPQDLILRFAFVMLADSSGRLLLHMRAASKPDYPLFWSGSAAGHLTSGETYVTGGERETWEELGIRVRLELLGRFYSPERRRWVGVLFGFHNGPVTIDRQEIARTEYFDPQRLDRLWESLPMTTFLRRSLALVLPRLEQLRTSGQLTNPPADLHESDAMDTGVNRPAYRAHLAAQWASYAAGRLAQTIGSKRLVELLTDAAANLRAAHELLTDTPGHTDNLALDWHGKPQDTAYHCTWSAAVLAQCLVDPKGFLANSAPRRHQHATVLAALAVQGLQDALREFPPGPGSPASRQESPKWLRPSSTPSGATSGTGDGINALSDSAERGGPPLTFLRLVEGTVMAVADNEIYTLPVLVHVDLNEREVDAIATGVQVVRCQDGSNAVLISAVPDQHEQ
ncbi:NUDIX hydrolase [Plantactinospora sp. WMMB334]|uniref:NUDIX hydrolase n=1 Tax=Plantactinospora sp. WMMB334 TaxID=3404119 RepID=UPI003B93785C